MIKNFLLAIFLLTLSVVATSAQSRTERSITNAQDQFFDIKKRSIEIERMKRESSNKTVSENLTARFPLIKEDFEQIQKLNDRLLQITAVKTPVDYALVSKFVSEINNRAARLNSNLFSAESKTKKNEKNKSKIVDEQEIKTLLKTLDETINSFVHSSIFQNLNLVNSDDSLKAQKDLETVINISYAIKTKTTH